MFDLCFGPGCQLHDKFNRAGTKGTSTAPAMAAVAPDDVQETVNALMHMAREFEEDECPLQAVKCYEAICNKNHLTVLESGQITADIATSSLEVHGRVSGNIEADDLVSLSSAANVVADIRAPRVVIEDGARFKGRIEMDVKLPPDV